VAGKRLGRETPPRPSPSRPSRCRGSCASRREDRPPTHIRLASLGPRRSRGASTAGGSTHASGSRLAPALGEARPQHVLREKILRIGDVPKRDLLPGRTRHAPVGIGEEPQVPEELAWGASLRAGSSASILGPPSENESPGNQLPGDAEAGVGAGSVRAEGQARVRSQRESGDSRLSQRSSAGTESWVRNATCPPRALRIRRFRVSPCEKFSRGIWTT
jgi:hypothetical protein